MNGDVDTTRVSKAHRMGLLRAIRRSFSWKCIFCSNLVFLSILYILNCHINHNSYSSNPSTIHGPCSQGYNLLPIIIAVVLYAIYLSECWHSRNKLSMLKVMRLDNTEEYLKQLRDSIPQVWWKALSYHYARRTRQVTRYRNGEALSSNQIYYERVDTVTGEENFIYDSCGVKDISGEPLDLHSFSAIRIYISRGFAFATMTSAREFEEQRSRFFDDYEQKDDYLEVREGMNLSEPIEHLLCIRKNKPWFLRPSLFWFFSIILLSFPIRVLIEWKTAFLHYRVIKLFGTNYLSPSSVNYTGPLSRCSTMDSIALTSAVISRSLLLPSYSMALLTPPIQSFDINNISPHIRSYGCIDIPPPILIPPPRSTSFNQYLSSQSQQLRRPVRSRSYGWISGFGRIDEEREGLIPLDDPPPYQIAIRLCLPIYNRIRSSLSRLHSSSSLHSLPKHLPRTTQT